MDMRVDRRGFLAAGAAVAGTAMCAGTLRAAGMAWDGKVAAGSFVHAFCTGSDAWSDLSPAAIFRALQVDTVFSVGGAAPGRAIERAVTLGVLGASITDRSETETLRVGVEFPNAATESEPRVFAAIVARRGETPSGVACRVPTVGGALGFSLLSGAKGKDDVRQRLQLPAKRGVYTLVCGDDLAGFRLRFNNGLIQSAWQCCVLISVAEANDTGDKK